MALWLPPSSFGPTQTNTTVSNRTGQSVVASSTIHTKGLYSGGQLIASTTEESYGVTVNATGVHVAATVTSYLLDIGIGPSGSEVDLIQNLDCWGAPTIAGQAGGKQWFFPVFVPQGTRVAARGQALIASDSCLVQIYLHQDAAGWTMEVPTLWESLGADTALSRGTSVTPASGAFGSWTTILDPITKNYRWWHVGFDALADNTIVANTNVIIELGIGDTSAAVSTISSWTFGKNSGEAIFGPMPPTPVFQPVINDGAKGIFARMASGGVEPRGVIVYAAE